MRVLLFAVCVLFGSVSCVVGEDSSSSKMRMYIGDEEDFFKKMCGNTTLYRAWKRKQSYDAHQPPYTSSYDYYMDTTYKHNNQYKLGTMADMLGGRERNRLVAFPDVPHRWQQGKGENRQSLLINNKAMRWFRDNKQRVKCTSFKNNFPLLSFPIAGYDKEFEMFEEDEYETRSHSWHFVGLDDDTMTFISASQKNRYSCGEDYCYHAQLLRFDSRGNFHRDTIVDGMPVAIEGILRVVDVSRN